MTPPRWLTWIFRSRKGIRPGWRIALFVLMTGCALVTVGLFMRYALGIHPRPSATLRPWPLLIGETITSAIIAGAGIVMARIESADFGSYGLGGPHKLRRASIGIAGGVLTLSAVACTLMLTGFMRLDGLSLHSPGAMLAYGVLWLATFFMVGVAEETTFRGYIQTILTRSLGFWPASLITSGIFTLAHMPNHGESITGLFGVIAAGLVFCLLLRLSGSLWLGIGFHAGWDWSETYLYGTPDSGLLPNFHLLSTHPAGLDLFSGGPAGPEGSILSGPGMVTGMLVLLWLYRRPGLFTAQLTAPDPAHP